MCSSRRRSLPSRRLHVGRALLGRLRPQRLQLRGLPAPALDAVPAPRAQVAHVLQQLVPRHHAGRAVSGRELRALAGGLRLHRLAHVIAEARQLVLDQHAALEISRGACLLPLGMRAQRAGRQREGEQKSSQHGEHRGGHDVVVTQYAAMICNILDRVIISLSFSIPKLKSSIEMVSSLLPM